MKQMASSCDRSSTTVYWGFILEREWKYEYNWSRRLSKEMVVGLEAAVWVSLNRDLMREESSWSAIAVHPALDVGHGAFSWIDSIGDDGRSSMALVYLVSFVSGVLINGSCKKKEGHFKQFQVKEGSLGNLDN